MIKDLLLNNIPNIESILVLYGTDLEHFSEAIENTKNVCKSIGFSYSKFSKLNKELFPDKPKGPLKTYLLNKYSNYKFCNCCNNYKLNSDFRANSSNKDGLNSWCKTCHSISTSKTQRHRQAKYNSKKLNAIPPWADLSKIKEFYENCPAGYEVDHIYPLQGKNISGLHVIDNLQYLTPKENQSKGNRVQ